MADKLGRYRKKRDFGTTPEPRGGDADAAGAGRFVVQEHHARRLHWDLRLEHDGALASWALPRGVPDHPDENRLAVHTEDHPLEYLEFEGDIPKGEYGAGTMRIWDSGTFEAEKFRDGEVIATFHGERLSGRYALFRTRGDDWMIHRMDPPADPGYEPMPERLHADARPPRQAARATRSATGSRSSGTASGRSPTRTTATGASRAATSPTSPRAIRSCASWRASSARTGWCSTARWWRWTSRAGRASSGCSSGCTSRRSRRSGGGCATCP